MWEIGFSIPIPNWTGFCLGSALATALLAAWGVWLAKYRGKDGTQ